MLTAFAATAGSGADEAPASELTKLFEAIITKIPLWIAALVIIFFTIVIAKIARRVVENKLAEKGLEEEHQEIQILVGRIVYAGIQVVGITAGLKIAGIDLTSIIAAVAFGIGFALKDMMMNFLAGIMILVGRHFTIGDFIKVGSTIGKVIEIQSRVTILQAIDGTKVIVPNANLFKKQVISFTSNPFRRVEVLVKIDFRNNLENAVKIAEHVLKNTKGVLPNPKPGVVVGDFQDNGVTLKLRAWVNSKGGWLKIKGKLVVKLKSEFDKHGIRIPWPIQTLAYDKDQELVEKIMEADEAEKEAPAAPVQPAIPATPAPMQPAVATANNAPAPAPAPMPPQTPPADQPLKPLGEN